MKICSLLPSATEIVFALDAGESVAGVTFECDYPAEAAGRRVLVEPTVRQGLTPGEIDASVRQRVASGDSLYRFDRAAFAAISPDVVLTQDLCGVCALSSTDLGQALADLPMARVLSLSPHTLEDVFLDIERVGEAIGRIAEATTLVANLRARLERVRSAAKGLPRQRVLCLEWLDPFLPGAHWIPEMIAIAGGEPVIAAPGARSVKITLEQIASADPEVLLIAPCGFPLAGAVEQYRAMTSPAGWQELRAVREGRVFAMDGNAHLSRPGPRLVDGVETLHAILHGSETDDTPAASFVRL